MQETTLVNEIVVPFSDRETFVKEVIADFWICCVSREASLLARKEVLTGKAKFGIVGDGKEVPQVAMARAFRKGDFRSGYYRDQTLMFALGLSTVEDFFAQLYADSDNDPFSAGRQMNSHYATPLVDEQGNWTHHTEQYNVSSDISSTGGQMARALGLALASKKYREHPVMLPESHFSNNGNEVCFCTIGDASTSEGVFWETVNAAAVLQVPLAISVWDDGYGISVPIDYQTVKKSISEALKGFSSGNAGEGIDLYTVKGWDYPVLCELYEKAIEKVRNEHKPALIHVLELTQPQGHSTSGSHERYKSPERLEWERQHDCIRVMKQWMIDAGIATESELIDLQTKAKQYVKDCREKAWHNYMTPNRKLKSHVKHLFETAIKESPEPTALEAILTELKNANDPLFSEIIKLVRQFHFIATRQGNSQTGELGKLLTDSYETARVRYHTHLYSETPRSALRVQEVRPVISENSPVKNGFEVLNAFFDHALGKYPQLFAFGEDVGYIGGVNQAFAGMQLKYGESRVFDTGIREWTIMGQALGMTMRGLRAIGEIQYLDYLIYGLETLMDDVATLRYRSNGQQCAPMIVRTRGHRLEGIWHAGSPMGMIINSIRGMYLLVPRNFVQAAGFYNTMLQSDDPALIVECLNGYRLKEKLPDNMGEYTVPLGIPEVLSEGTDVTLVTYGSCVRVAEAGVKLLSNAGISVELIDVQTLLPFDREHRIAASLSKTNRIVFMDEDVPGGATAYMMQQVLEIQGGYQYLDSNPVTLTAKAHRPPYGSDGDYFTKPNVEDVFETVYKLMHEVDPTRFPAIY